MFNYLKLLSIFSLVLLGSEKCYAQKFQNGNLNSQKLDTSKKVIPFGEDYQMDFPSVNKKPYYSNKGKLQKIKKYESQKKYDKALVLLRDYVSHFGVDNFTLENNLIWRLGQLEEKMGNKEKADAAFRLAIFHNNKKNTEIKQYYDSLINDNKHQYVPLEYYYDMVEIRKKIDTIRPPMNVYVNMGDAVNSKYEDYGPTLNVKNNLLIFTSKRVRRENKEAANEDIFISEYKDGEWSKAKPIGQPINSKYNEGSACLTKDGAKIYFARCNCSGCLGNCDIFEASLKEDGTWGRIQNLGPAINSPYWDSQPSLSPSDDTLFFASSRTGGFGGSDIYYSVKQKDGTWGKAQNIGPVLNTKASEVSPFYHRLHHVLYYSSHSEGPFLNFGDFDIYRSHLVKGKFREPKNIGPLVNGPGSEYYFAIDSESKNIYYARSEEDDLKNLELFSFPLPMEAHPLATTVFVGTLVDSATGNPFQGIVTIIDLDNGIEIAPKFIRPDGSYEFDLIDNNDYLLVIQGEDFFRIEKEFHLNGDTKMEMKTPTMNTKKWVFKNLVFKGGSADILPEMEEDLKKLLDYMVDNPNVTLKISGHTDSSGNEESNRRLSQRRADSIRAYLIEKSQNTIEEGRIEAVGYGSSKPLVEEKTETDRELNRRVEFEITTNN